MLLNKKIKAGALQFTILVSVVIAAILSAFILISYSQLRFEKQLQRSSNVIKLVHDGINYAKQKAIVYNDSISIQLEEEMAEEITLYKTHWGIFDKVISRGKSKIFVSQNIALLGGQLSKDKRPAVYLEDSNSPLVVVGNTTIQGNVILPRQGVRPGNIAGNYYNGTSLVYGGIKQDASVKPQITEEKKDYIKSLLFGDLPQEDSLLIRSSASKITATFKTNPKWLYRPDAIEIGNQEIRNNIIIKSDSLIRISAFAKADNIILIAPYIEIDANVEGSFQAFASKGISVGENTKLSYPSVLVVLENENTINSNQEELQGIVLKKGSIISGSVIHLKGSENTYQKPMITINEDAMVQGEIYSDHSVQIEGIVKGSVYTHQFAIQARGSVYKNHLFDATIDSRNFPESFCGVITTETETNVVQWLD
ncbi:hypothetical protein GCM10011344_27300 [Dokdonia pacifica]|uniref:Uncharacterized protein n=1 Tax=Dokdonia pacifica TaxID=1627892 RepID=A0A239E7N6_9FLAO|nr:hypothetical protein [Dokdonia pacifica]GGG25169.1 hypothetical protein GCM10011344_27300 [Dokdonia pacifica]SNS39894.1 hypothetical protein SAMN06265376_11414 [Dokdonia pacifica]